MNVSEEWNDLKIAAMELACITARTALEAVFVVIWGSIVCAVHLILTLIETHYLGAGASTVGSSTVVVEVADTLFATGTLIYLQLKTFQRLRKAFNQCRSEFRGDYVVR